MLNDTSSALSSSSAQTHLDGAAHDGPHAGPRPRRCRRRRRGARPGGAPTSAARRRCRARRAGCAARRAARNPGARPRGCGSMASHGSRVAGEHVLVVQVAVQRASRRTPGPPTSSRCEAGGARARSGAGSASRRRGLVEPAGRTTCPARGSAGGAGTCSRASSAADDLARLVGVDGAQVDRSASSRSSSRSPSRGQGGDERARRRHRPRCAGRAAPRRCRRCGQHHLEGQRLAVAHAPGATTAVQPVRSGPSASRPHRSKRLAEQSLRRRAPTRPRTGRPRRAAATSRRATSAGMTGTSGTAHCSPGNGRERDAPPVRLDLDGAQPAGQRRARPAPPSDATIGSRCSP